jgi:hypothetical protein
MQIKKVFFTLQRILQFLYAFAVKFMRTQGAGIAKATADINSSSLVSIPLPVLLFFLTKSCFLEG